MNYILITGASAGIGEVFAEQLAAQGHNLILTARREERLQALASKLESQYKISTQIIAADLSDSNGAETLASKIINEGWALNGLINNAGFGDRGAFTELSLDRQLQMIQLNVCLLYTSPSPRDKRQSRMPSSA